MPVFDIKQEDSPVVQKATFDKKEDYKVVTLNNDPIGRERLLHVIQANRLIKNGKAKEVKNVNLEVREVVSTISPAPKHK